jgi:hypothetical protein
MMFLCFLVCDLEYRVNLLRKRKVEGQKHGQKGLFVTLSMFQTDQVPIHPIQLRPG